MLSHHSQYFLIFFFNATATTEIYTLSLHDALPIYDLFDTTTNAHLFKYDSNYGNYPGEVEAREKRSEEHTSELQSRFDLVCRLLLEKKKISLSHQWISIPNPI